MPPTVTLRTEMTLHRGSREIQLRFLGRGHTGGDVVVFLPRERIVITGDFLTSGLSNLSDSYPDEWVTSLEALKKLPFDTVLPGHGEAFTDKRQDRLFPGLATRCLDRRRAAEKAGRELRGGGQARGSDPHKGNIPAIQGPGIPVIGGAAHIRADGRAGPVTVCVTGATGFVASWLVADLLRKGEHVRGTVRDRTRAGHLTSLPGAAERLTLVEADLQTPGAFDDAVAGCTTVFHTASPYVVDVEDPQRDLVDPAVQGTLNVLGACRRAPGVARLVLTSSMAAVTDEPDSDHVLTEADWNTKSTLDRNPYYLSKTLAERAAWDFMARERPRFDLVVVNPFVIMGPSLSRAVNTSNQILVDLVKGVYPAIISLTWGLVDVRDVATAHVRAAEVPAASGRYLCAQQPVTMRQIVGWLREAGFGARHAGCRAAASTTPSATCWCGWTLTAAPRAPAATCAPTSAGRRATTPARSAASSASRSGPRARPCSTRCTTWRAGATCLLPSLPGTL